MAVNASEFLLANILLRTMLSHWLTKKPIITIGFLLCVKPVQLIFYFFFAFGLGMSVILPSKISAAKPIDSFNVGWA